MTYNNNYFTLNTTLDSTLFEVDSSKKGYNLNSWRQDLKTAMLTAGLENKEICFMACDSQLTEEKMLEDINDILNGEEFFELYIKKEIDQIF